jgi:hypothetical protein
VYGGFGYIEPGLAWLKSNVDVGTGEFINVKLWRDVRIKIHPNIISVSITLNL